MKARARLTAVRDDECIRRDRPTIRNLVRFLPPVSRCIHKGLKELQGRWIGFEGAFRVPLHGENVVSWQGAFDGFDYAILRTAGAYAQTVADNIGRLMMAGV